jgi:hypothetical protein
MLSMSGIKWDLLPSSVGGLLVASLRSAGLWFEVSGQRSAVGGRRSEVRVGWGGGCGRPTMSTCVPRARVRVCLRPKREARARFRFLTFCPPYGGISRILFNPKRTKWVKTKTRSEIKTDTMAISRNQPTHSLEPNLLRIEPKLTANKAEDTVQTTRGPKLVHV